MIFSSGIGIEITNASVWLAHVSFWGRILETKQLDLSASLVVDDLVVDSEGLRIFLNKEFFKAHFRGRRIQTVLCLPESRVFSVDLQDGKELQTQIPVFVEEAVVVKSEGTPNREIIQTSVLKSFVDAVDSTLIDLRAIERRTAATDRFMVNFKNKSQDASFQAAIGAAQRAAHPWRYKHCLNFLSSYESEKQ